MIEHKPLPQLKIKYDEPNKPTVTCNVEECQHFLEFTADNLVIVNQQIVWSYDELVNVLKQDEYESKDCIEIFVTPNIMDGG